MKLMVKKFKVLMMILVVVGGCSTNKIPLQDNRVDKEIVNNKEETSESLTQKVEYENVKDGLLMVKNQYGLDVNYMLLDVNNKKVGNKMSPTYIVIHNTSNSAPAINEAKYLNSSSNTLSTSFHFAVDNTSVYQTVNMNYNAWHAGNISMNKKSIGIEIAKSTIKDENIKNKAIENGAKLTAILMKHYNIPLDNVITHYDVTGKDCPHDILHRYGFDNFKSLVNNYLN